MRKRDHLEDLGLDGRIILKRIFRKWNGEAWAELSGSGQGEVVGACQCANGTYGSIKLKEFLGKLRNG
jgi:hypothetical protein